MRAAVRILGSLTLAWLLSKVGEAARHPRYFGCADCPQWFGFPFAYSYHSGGIASLYHWNKPWVEAMDYLLLLVIAGGIFWIWELYRRRAI
jgi:hypothetical protein